MADPEPTRARSAVPPIRRRHHGMTPRGAARVIRSPLPDGRFGRMFRKLPPAPEYSPDQLQELAESMREAATPGGGWSGAADPQNGDNPDIPAAYTYFGQFLDHDITFDATSRPQVINDPDALINFRTPRYDLDSLYGSGPVDEPFHYDQQRPGRLLTGANAAGDADLPRNEQGTALIGDPRNDENVIVSGLHLLMLRLHNRFLDELDAADILPAAERFEEASRLLRWHYQWVVVRDYLPRICGADLVKSLYDPERGDVKRRFYRPRTNAYMPVEFSAAAFRFGHSQVRADYHLNDAIGVRPIFAPGDTPGTGSDLRGFQPLLPGWSVDWPSFVPIAGSEAQPSRLIDARLAEPLFDLPGIPGEEPQSLAFLNLRRGQALQLPCGQDVARAMGIAPLDPATLGTDLVPTPLWFYLLKEAEITGDDNGNPGRRLGPTGARIVAEVLLGLLELDPASYLNREPGWQPSLPGESGIDGSFGLGDLIDAARQ